MAESVTPPLPAGFTLDGSDSAMPPLPAGFRLDAPEQPKSTSAPSVFDRIKGAGETAATIATGAIAAPIGAAAGIFKTLTGGKYGTPEGIREGATQASDVSRSLTYAPRTETGQDYLRSIGGALDASKLAGLGPTEAMALAGTTGPAIRATQSRIIDPAINAIKESPEAALIKAAPAAMAKAVLPMPKPEVARLARVAQSLDMPLRPDMLTDNRFARMLGEAFEKIPLSGSKAEARQIAFNRAIASQIGADRNATKLTPDVFKGAMDASGGTIGDIAKRTPVALDESAMMTLAKQAENVDKFHTSDVAKVVKSYIAELTAKADGDVIPGDTFRRINTKLGSQLRTTSNGDLRAALSSLQDDMHEMLIANIKNPQDISVLQEARKQYAIGKVIEPLVAKARAGDISPAALMGAVTNTKFKKGVMARGGGEMGDLARIGQLFLKEPLSSGTAERAAIYGGLLGGGAFIEPTTAGALFGSANLYNRTGQSVTNGILNLQQKPSFSATSLVDLLRQSQQQ